VIKEGGEKTENVKEGGENVTFRIVEDDVE